MPARATKHPTHRTKLPGRKEFLFGTIFFLLLCLPSSLPYLFDDLVPVRNGLRIILRLETENAGGMPLCGLYHIRFADDRPDLQMPLAHRGKHLPPAPGEERRIGK